MPGKRIRKNLEPYHLCMIHKQDKVYVAFLLILTQRKYIFHVYLHVEHLQEYAFCSTTRIAVEHSNNYRTALGLLQAFSNM